MSETFLHRNDARRWATEAERYSIGPKSGIHFSE